MTRYIYFVWYEFLGKKGYTQYVFDILPINKKRELIDEFFNTHFTIFINEYLNSCDLTGTEAKGEDITKILVEFLLY